MVSIVVGDEQDFAEDGVIRRVGDGRGQIGLGVTYQLFNRLQIGVEEEEDPPFKMVDGIMVILGGGPTPGGLAKAIREERDAMADRSKRTR